MYDENVFLSTSLKNIKDNIDELFTKFDPRSNPVKSHPISDALKYKPVEEQLRTRDREIENAEKALANVLLEYKHVSEKVEQVRNPVYLNQLQEQVDKLSQEIKVAEKDIKHKELFQQKREV